MFKKLALKNYKTHKDTVLEFSPGVNVITGDTGQGKTNILLSLAWVKDNRPLGTGCIRRGQDSGSVIFEVEEYEDVYGIVRSRGKANNSYSIEKNGVAIGDPFTAFGNSPPEAVSKILNLSDINIQKQRDQHFLVYSPPGQIAAYIRSITKLDEISQVVKLLSSKIHTEEKGISRCQKELKSTNDELTALNKIDLELLESKITEAKDRILAIEQIKEKVKRIEFILNELMILEEHRIVLPDNIDQIFEDVDFRQESIADVSSRLSKLKTLVGKINKIEANKIVLPDNIDEVFKDVDVGQESIADVSSRLSKLKVLIDEIKQIEANKIVLPEDLTILSTVEDASEEFGNQCERLGKLRTLCGELRPVVAMVADYDRRIGQLEVEKRLLEEQLETCPSCGTELTEKSKRVLLER